jgi:predicted AAA+ superfamily ATPase
MIARFLQKNIEEKMFKGKVITLLGARQTGKTTLLKLISKNYSNTIWLNADEYDIQEKFKNPTSTGLKALIGNAELVIIDEAQKISGIGLALKLLIDNYPSIQIVATGSSAFELSNILNEPLTGRKFEFQLYPIATSELNMHHSELIENRMLTHRLIFGYYPDVINNEGNEIDVLKLLADSYLFRDVLMLDNIKKPEKLIKLIKALAFQVGNEVSYNEIGNLIGLDSKTVESYIQILEKSFVIYKLSSFSRNHRNELKNGKKIYFYDNGIRNALISNFQLAEGRQDIGALWENYLIAERIKQNEYLKSYTNSFFWRTKDGLEIDYIEEVNGELKAYEFKWNVNKKHRITSVFSKTYGIEQVIVITPENYMEFVTNKV